MKIRKDRETAATLAHIASLLAYDRDTGLLTWRTTLGRARAGAVAGSIKSNGYVAVCINRNMYRAHRIAWALSNGYWPINDIDHADGNRSNNRISNLRDVTRGENMQNQRGARSNSLIGKLGVSKNKSRWMARIKANGVVYHVGTFDTPELAHAAYVQRKRELHTNGTI